MTPPCPKCSSTNSTVSSSARRKGSGKVFSYRIDRVMRRHLCLDCDHRWGTVELPVETVETIFGVAKRCGELLGEGS